MCKTLGVGFYKSLRYGSRWYGDFSGAVPGLEHTFCIDFRYWYPAAQHRYRLLASAGLHNRNGERVSTEHRQRMAYAVWTYGRSTNRAQQAAVMLYVHSLMGDARQGEVDPAAVSARVAALFRRVSNAASRYHGPYRVDVDFQGTAATTAGVRIRAASGAALRTRP